VPALRALVAAGVDVVNVESPLELRRLARVADEAGRTVAAAIRVNPADAGDDAPARAGTLRMGGTPSAFGVGEADVGDVLALAGALPSVDVVGFHVHAVSQNLDAAAHLAYVARCLEWSTRTAARHGVDLRVVDVGGGFGVPFEPDRLGERPFDLGLFADGLAGLRPPTGVRVLFEPGRWLVADCGWYVAEVTDVKRSYGDVFVVLHGGIHHFQLPTSWEIVHNVAVVGVDGWPPGWPRPAAEDEPVTVVGELCTPEDTLLRDVTVARVRAGDVVVFPMAGSYGWEFAMPEFLGHPPARRVALG
jgi:diaminopimelate decarboxylase